MTTRVLLAPAVVLLAGCAGGLALGGNTASYSAANAIYKIGYSEKSIDETHYEVKAAGTDATPRERVEKIALARAAEIGVEQRLPYFRVANATHGADCTKKQSGYKGSDAQATYHPTVVLDVYYSKTPLPDHRPSADTFAQVKAELDADATPPEVKAAAAAQIRAECGAT